MNSLLLIPVFHRFKSAASDTRPAALEILARAAIDTRGAFPFAPAMRRSRSVCVEALQLIVCTGPKCTRMNQKLGAAANGETIGAAASRVAAESVSPPVYVGSYECLARCAMAPNLLVKTLTTSNDPGDPGLFDLDGSQRYGYSRASDVAKIVEAHSQGSPLKGSEEY